MRKKVLLMATALLVSTQTLLARVGLSAPCCPGCGLCG